MEVKLTILQNKYPGAVKEGKKIILPINVRNATPNIYLEEGIWRIKPLYLEALTKDVIEALGLEGDIRQASQIRRRVIALPNNTFLFEFTHKDLK